MAAPPDGMSGNGMEQDFGGGMPFGEGNFPSETDEDTADAESQASAEAEPLSTEGRLLLGSSLAVLLAGLLFAKLYRKHN